VRETAPDWHGVIAAESRLPPDAARQLSENGFVVVPGPSIPGGPEQLSEAYDGAVATAEPADVSIRSSTRVNDFVNRGPEFDGIYVYGPLLAACSMIIGGPFKLSGMRARTLEPGAPTEALHVDVKHRADGWPLVGFILMVDAFDAENGATRFVPGSHLQPRDPRDVLKTATEPHEDEVLACGPAGSIIIFNASAWHSHTANRSARRRRSVQGHFVLRNASAAEDQAERMRPETFRRIGALAKYVLDVR
jgi:Phytanoyl-CoA dioxygenase (PhyH)